MIHIFWRQPAGVLFGKKTMSLADYSNTRDAKVLFIELSPSLFEPLVYIWKGFIQQMLGATCNIHMKKKLLASLYMVPVPNTGVTFNYKKALDTSFRNQMYMMIS